MRRFAWKKLGLIFSPDSSLGWMNSHAQVPFSLLFDDFFRVYFSTREAVDYSGNFRSYSGYVDFDRKSPFKIIDVSKRPIIKLGGLAEFDEFGSMAGSVVRSGDEFYLYYCGWQRCSSIPYNWAIGLAKSKDGKTFTKHGKGPIVAANPQEPYLQACPIVYRRSDNDWHMYYLSGIKWFKDESGKAESQYLIMHATSHDGINWSRVGTPLLPTVVENECQTSCSIIFRDGLYHMFFSYRYGSDFRSNADRGYRIGYAYSNDLVNWVRDDSLSGLDVSSEGWDSKMIGYPHLQVIDDKLYLFYCGNEFGKDGFGCAVHEDA